MGTVITTFMSNDAVVLTPAVLAAVKRAGGRALPYVFACAFIANAASFVLPISNPANRLPAEVRALWNRRSQMSLFVEDGAGRSGYPRVAVLPNSLDANGEESQG